jgi:hypothetical protein
MTSTPVTADQFQITDEGITHKPTGFAFTHHPGSPLSGTARLGQLGNKLASGEDYRPDQVKAMANDLWAKHCAATGKS